jgi:hypothetical protein
VSNFAKEMLMNPVPISVDESHKMKRDDQFRQELPIKVHKRNVSLNFK